MDVEEGGLEGGGGGVWAKHDIFIVKKFQNIQTA
jgi:hypothetical protein